MAAGGRRGSSLSTGASTAPVPTVSPVPVPEIVSAVEDDPLMQSYYPAVPSSRPRASWIASELLRAVCAENKLWGYFFEQGYETSQALQARLATFLRGTAGWTVAVEQW